MASKARKRVNRAIRERLNPPRPDPMEKYRPDIEDAWNHMAAEAPDDLELHEASLAVLLYAGLKSAERKRAAR